MGLFNFAKNIGKKLFGSDDDDAAEKIKKHIEEDNPGIENLDVSFENGEVKISGDAANSAALEKAVLMAGNVEGVESINIDGVTGAAPSDNVEYYEIKKGDTLWAISKHFYGNGNDYKKIVEENKEVIKNADKIYPGQKIRIPK